MWQRKQLIQSNAYSNRFSYSHGYASAVTITHSNRLSNAYWNQSNANSHTGA